MERLFKNFLGVLILRDLESKLHDRIDNNDIIRVIHVLVKRAGSLFQLDRINSQKSLKPRKNL